MPLASFMNFASVASVHPALWCSAIAVSIFVFWSAVRSRLAREAVQAIFPSFPAFFAQSPCSPANIVPAANAPAATSAMSLVIVEAETASAGSPFNLEIVWHLVTGRVSLTTLKIEAKEEIWPLHHPFRISRGSRTETQVVVATMADGEHVGRGECVPIKRYNQSAASVLAQIESIQDIGDLDRNKLQQLLPPGAARNALGCALWDLEAKRSGKGVWELANVPIVEQVATSFTISLDTPERMADAAAAGSTYQFSS